MNSFARRLETLYATRPVTVLGNHDLYLLMVAYGAVRSRYVSGETYASTLVIVSGFTRPEFKVEVEITAARLP